MTDFAAAAEEIALEMLPLAQAAHLAQEEATANPASVFGVAPEDEDM